MSDAATLRDATDDDAAAVAAIYGHYVRESVATFDLEPRSVEQWRAIWADLRAAGWPCLVAELDGAVAGFAHVGPYRPKPAYARTVESSVYLAPGRTGAGLGTLLMTTLLQRAAANDALQVVAVIADTGDPSSRRLHERLGFTEVGTLRGVGHKFGRAVDTLIMQCALEW